MWSGVVRARVQLGIRVKSMGSRTRQPVHEADALRRNAGGGRRDGRHAHGSDIEWNAQCHTCCTGRPRKCFVCFRWTVAVLFHCLIFLFTPLVSLSAFSVLVEWQEGYPALSLIPIFQLRKTEGELTNPASSGEWPLELSWWYFICPLKK